MVYRDFQNQNTKKNLPDNDFPEVFKTRDILKYVMYYVDST